MITYEVVKKVAVISDTGGGNTKEVNIVKWGNYAPSIDVRRWSNGVPSKGISLTETEAKELLKALQTMPELEG